MYFIPTGLMISKETGRLDPALSWSAFLLDNLLPVTLGNIVGGVVFVACAYWYVHSGAVRESRTS
jgi:formate/nitrite transporter FocA (FNT family)